MSAWPWPGDNQLDIARRVVGIYRAALAVKDAERCAELDDKMHELGQPWVVPEQVELDLDAEVTVVQAAGYVNRTVWTIYDWIEKGWLVAHRRPSSTDGRRKTKMYVRLGDLFDTQRDVRKRRAG